MKAIVLLGLILFPLAIVAQNETVKVPDAVMKSVKELHPDATGLKWEQKKELYKAEFKTGKIDHKLWLRASGAVSKHQYEIKKDQLPKEVSDAILKDYSGYTIGDCDKTEEKDVTTYKVELKSPQGKKNVTFSSDGKVIPKKKDSE